MEIDDYDDSQLNQAIDTTNQILLLTKSLKTMTIHSIPNIPHLIQPIEEQYWEFTLDNALVSVLTPILRNEYAYWNPLDQPTLHLSLLKSLRKYLIPTDIPEKRDKMIPYEAMLHQIWFPRVRSALTYTLTLANCRSEWTFESDKASTLLEAWFPSSTFDKTEYPPDSMIPFWMYNLLVEQVVYPKIRDGLQNWNPNQPIAWLLPWIHILKHKLSDMYVIVRQAIVVYLQDWDISDHSAIQVISIWKEIMPPQVYNGLLARAIIPKLVYALREMEINPANQDLSALQNTFIWFDHMSNEMFGKLLETEFFPKWLQILELWMSSPGDNYSEVTTWYQSWKDLFPTHIQNLRHVKNGFRKALDFMNTGISNKVYTKTFVKHMAVPRHSSFKEILEQKANDRGILLIPENNVKIVGVTRFVIYTLSTALGKKGSQIYIDDGVVFLKSGEAWKPVSIDEALSSVSL
jgi:tuftelin-interacting protein 11